MPFKIIPFEPWHCAGEFKLMESFDQENWRKNLIVSYHQGPVWTGYWDNHLIGFGGVRNYWKGVGEVWVMLNKNRPQVPTGKFIKELVLGLNKQIKDVVFNLGYWRVQAYCHHATPNAPKLLKAIGFKFEGLMKKYCPDGSDSFLYAMVKE